MEDLSRFLLGRLPVLFGIGLIENAYDHTMDIVGVPARELPDREPALLERAKRNMPRICVPDMDVLIVDRIGKNFSGSGMDPNVTGRFYNKAVPAVPAAQRITVLGLSNETHGNACGLGVADTTTRRVAEHLDRESMYINSLTSRVAESSRIPMYFETDREAIQAAIWEAGPHPTAHGPHFQHHAAGADFAFRGIAGGGAMSGSTDYRTGRAHAL